MPAFTVLLNVATIQPPVGFRLIGIKAFTSMANQSIEIHKGEVTVLFDGYIYNLPALYRNFSKNSEISDEVEPIRLDYSILIDIYCEFGMEYLLQVLDGTFRFVLLDQRLSLDDSQMYIVNDSMGIRPIYNITEHSTNISIGDTYTFTTDKPTNIGSFSLEYSSSPATCYKFTLANRVRSDWTMERQYTYSLLGKSGGFPRIIYHPDNKVLTITPDFQEFTKKITEYHLSCSIDKHLLDFNVDSCRTIFCVVSNDDYESRIIANLASRMSIIPEVPETNDDEKEEQSNINIVKISIDHLSDTSPASILAFIREACQQYGNIDSLSETGKPYHVWMSSGLLNHEKNIKRVTKRTMSYDHSYREYVHKIGEDHLIHNLIEPGKEMGLEIAFPFLERSWLQYYLSIHPHYRYSTSVVEEAMRDYM
jgi:hypothetical protein